MKPLGVTRNDEIADGIHLLDFRDPDGCELPAFDAGAHLSTRVPSGLVRKYSLCNDPTGHDHYLIAVKRETNSRGGSISLLDEAKVGSELLVGAPVNNFGLPRRCEDFLFIAGGIGITPIRAMIYQVRAENKRFRLYYCTRSPQTTAFLERTGYTGIRKKTSPFITIMGILHARSTSSPYWQRGRTASTCIVVVREY